MTRWPLIRDVTLFVGGFAGVAVLLSAWVVARRPPDPSFLVIFAAMMGLPAFLRADERRGG